MEMIKCWPQTTKTLFFWDGAVDGSIPAGDTTATCNSVQCCVSWDLAILFLRAFRLVFVFVDKTHWMIKEADVNLYVKCYSVTASASHRCMGVCVSPGPDHNKQCTSLYRPEKRASVERFDWLIDIDWYLFLTLGWLHTYNYSKVSELVSKLHDATRNNNPVRNEINCTLNSNIHTGIACLIALKSTKSYLFKSYSFYILTSEIENDFNATF